MADGGADAPPPPPENGGEFLLSLLHKRPYHPERHGPSTQSPSFAASEHQPVVLDPAVAAVGPTVPAFPPRRWPSDGRDLSGTPPNLPANLLGFSQFPLNHLPLNQLGSNQSVLGEDAHRLGFPGAANHSIEALTQQQQLPPPVEQQQLPPPVEQQKLLFGSFTEDAIQNPNGLRNGKLVYDSKFSSTKDHERHLRNPQSNWSIGSNLSGSGNFYDERRGGYGGCGSGGHYGNNKSFKSTPPPGFPSKQRGWDRYMGNNDGNNRKVVLQQNVDSAKAGHSNLSNTVVSISVEDDKLRRSSIQNGSRLKLSRQLHRPGPSSGSNLHSVSAFDVEGSRLVLQKGGGGKERSGQFSRARKEATGNCKTGDDEIEEFGEDLVDSLLLGDEADDKDVNNDKDEKKKRRNFREKESRIDDRGQWLLSQRLRMLKRQMPCRSDIHRVNAPFLAVFDSLIPADEELVKQKQLLALLEKLVSKEWPEAKLFLYGSCANSFGFPKSDIDVCLAIKDVNLNKSEVLLKLADILQSDNLQNVQALTRARVPIVKLMDPVTGISCDICINNVLAVVNTKLLRDYAQIDVRLRQLAFIVKHWAKSRRVNETYRGTLSSYAYVLMCIHFLQQRSPAILPCLQDMEPTYSVTVDNIHCAYFDDVDKLSNFGSRNRETIGQLVWGFFNYWAYGHDYANSVISVRTGSIISKQEKDWTRRVGNDRHLICIEDPFETSHDLGRVVDRFSIRVLRGEFERAAEIMHHDPNPCVRLFEPYVRGDH